MKTIKAWVLVLLVAALAGCTGDGLPLPIFASATPTPSPSPSPTVTPTATATPSPTPTPTPTPAPADRLAAAQRAYRVGDWETAAALFQALREQGGATVEQRAQAALGLSHTYLAMGANENTIAIVEELLANDLTAQAEDLVVDAHLLLADALHASGVYTPAAQQYAAVAEAEPLLSSYAYERMGDALWDAGEVVTATDVYSSALGRADSVTRQASLLEKVALGRAGQGDYAGAMAAYDAILDRAVYSSYRARIMRQAAETALLFGDADEAYTRMQVLVATYPEEESAYLALVKLVEAGVQVDEMLRGLVDYHAGAYGPAVEAFYRLIRGDPDHDGEPHYYAGLSYLEAGSLQLALDEFDLLIETHPDDPYVPGAWMAKARTLNALGQASEALETYLYVATTYADHTRAPEAMRAASALLVSQGDLAQAADLLEQMADLYPDDAEAARARFRAGLLRYQGGDLDGARAAWQALTVWYPSDEQAQAAWFWLGKSQLGAGLVVSATEALSTAVNLAPWSYYGLRAADLMTGQPPFWDEAVAQPFCTTPQAQAEAEAWLAGWLGLDAATAVGELPETLRNDARLRRGTLLLRLGHFDEGRSELEALRVETTSDPLTQYRLALYFRDVGLNRSSIIAAAAVWRQSSVADFSELPVFIGCLAYPTYYSTLVTSEAAAHNLAPLFVYALLRQESLFEGSATSIAAAHGLMQVIPPTGAYVAESLGWPPGYETRDLYRPMVSVRFGVWYLAEQRDLLDGNLFAAMAAYNGGPGNAMRWWAAAGEDEDLFVELIDFAETRSYVRLIREHYGYYRWLYAEPHGGQ